MQARYFDAGTKPARDAVLSGLRPAFVSTVATRPERHVVMESA